jgi:hypothetical protein
VVVEAARSGRVDVGAKMGRNCCGGNYCVGSMAGGGSVRYEANFSLHTHSRVPTDSISPAPHSSADRLALPRRERTG